MTGEPSDLGTVLGVWAHPDDETFLSAGLMAEAVGAGRRVTVVTATRGEAGTVDPERWPPHRLARIRELELHAALAVLGVEDHHFLGYLDGTLASVPLEEGTGHVARILAEARPDTVLTFGPEGMTGHTDHMAVSAWATQAWEEAGRPCRLLYATKPPGFEERFADIHRRFQVFFAGGPPCTEEEDLALAFDLPDPLLDRKLVAIRAQASQVEAVVSGAGVERFREWISLEAFVEAYRSG